MDTSLFENEAYMRMLYDQFRTSTNGQFGDNTLLISAIGEVFCNSPHTMIYVGCGSGNGLSSFRQAYHPKQWICIDSNPDLLKQISLKCTKICATISSRDNSLTYRFSDPTFCGLTDISSVLIDQYKLVRLPNEEVKCKPLDSIIGEVDKERSAHALADPEIQFILNDPSVRQVLTDFQENPKFAQQAMGDPVIRAKIEKLIAAGVLQVK
jgi:hypothetical protein